MSEKETKVAEEKPEVEEILFENGPTVNQIERWKSEYNGNVFMTEVDDNNVFIWRTINRLEYKGVIKNQNADALFREERICELCVLWPENYDFTKMNKGLAGAPSLIAEQVMDKSGFIPNREVKRL